MTEETSQQPLQDLATLAVSWFKETQTLSDQDLAQVIRLVSAMRPRKASGQMVSLDALKQQIATAKAARSMAKAPASGSSDSA